MAILSGINNRTIGMSSHLDAFIKEEHMLLKLLVIIGKA